MKETVITITTFAVAYGGGVITYYSGYPQIGEGVAIISCIGLALWGFGFAATHSPQHEHEA